MYYPRQRSENLEYRAKLLDHGASNDVFAGAIKTVISKDFEGLLFWVNCFLWIFEPRVEFQIAHGSKDAHLPFITYDYQDDLLKRAYIAIVEGSNLGVEKSRDMGVTWLLLALFTWFWQFKGAGNDFHLGSRKEELVDKLGDISALMPKVRYLIKRQPVWLRPEGFSLKAHAGFMAVSNPATGSMMRGESSNLYFGSGGRKKAMMYDEFPKWDNIDESAWQAGSDVTQTKFAIGSANGKNNHFYRLRAGKAGEIDFVRLHWSKHPHKDQAWYEREKAKRSPEDLAAEVDIDYAASVSNKAYYAYNPAIHVIPIERNLLKPLVLMTDFNIDPMSWTIGHEERKVMLVFDELVIRGTSTEQAAAEFKERYRDHGLRELTICGDATGQSRSRVVRGTPSDYDIIKRILGPTWKVMLDVPPGNPAVTDRVKAMNRCLCDWSRLDDHTGRPMVWFYFDPRCKFLQESFEQTQLVDGGIDKRGNIEHSTDGPGYWAHRRHPIIERALRTQKT